MGWPATLSDDSSPTPDWLRHSELLDAALDYAALGWMIFCAETNGFDRALIKRGRRVLIDVPEFERWLESQRLGEVESVPAHEAK